MVKLIKNYNEVIINEVINDLIENGKDDFFACTCEDCINNIKAIVLNEMKPFYVTCKVGEIFGQYKSKDPQGIVDVISKVAKAKETVRKNPRHSNANRISV